MKVILIWSTVGLFIAVSVCHGQTRQPRIRIPIVVHVLFKDSKFDVGNPEIIKEIDFLISDFQGINPDTTQIPEDFKYFFAKPGIEFYLANDPATNQPAIYRPANIPRNNFKLRRRNVFHHVAPKEPDKFLNIYITSIRRGKTRGYVNSEAWENPRQDGVVLHYAAVKEHSRVITHEVGHWLGLYHIFSQDDVDDTPTQKVTNGCPIHPKISYGHPVMFVNFMDYSDCRVMFTKGQVQKMLSVIQNHRTSFIENPSPQ